MAPRPALRALTERLGVASAYEGMDGRLRPISAARHVALLAAMGIDAADEAAATRALTALERTQAGRLVEPVRVVRAGKRWSPTRLGGTPGSRETVSWRLELTEEQGARCDAEGRGTTRADGSIAVRLPTHPPPGYHVVRVWMRGPEGERTAVQRLIVVPDSCYTIGEALGRQRAFGIITNLYGARSSRDWGIGDLGTLAELAEWAGEIGSAFVGMNPLHALRNRGWDVSPYNPVSRLFRNVLYLDVEAIPELAESRETRERIASPGFQAELEHCRQAARVDYGRVMDLKWPVLEALFATFASRHGNAETERGRAYARFKEEQGSALVDFATFLALGSHLTRGTEERSWRDWPDDLRSPRSKAVRDFRASNAETIELHCYLQFELDRQLGMAARRGAVAGLEIGLYQDLAVGTAGDGSDSWAFPDLFVHDASVGAPPDDYSAWGQDWGFPPLDPHRLREQGYAYWIRLLQAAFAHAGALRIDHAMGLVRLYWIPRGQPAAEGCYVRYPAQDLFGILALESRRHRAIVIGEDLGTVPRGFPSLLARWGVLSSRVLYFEQTKRRGFRPASQYSRRALVTATTHDHPTLVGYRGGRDLELRRATGSLGADEDLEQSRAHRAKELVALERRLLLDGATRRDAAAADDTDFVGAVHTFLAGTAAPLVGVYLDDLLGESEPVNLPGVGPDRYPSWSRRLRLPVEQARQAPEVNVALGGLRSRALR